MADSFWWGQLDAVLRVGGPVVGPRIHVNAIRLQSATYVSARLSAMTSAGDCRPLRFQLNFEALVLRFGRQIGRRASRTRRLVPRHKRRRLVSGESHNTLKGKGTEMAKCVSCKRRKPVDGHRCQPCLDRLHRVLEGTCARLTQALGIQVVPVQNRLNKRRVKGAD